MHCLLGAHAHGRRAARGVSCEACSWPISAARPTLPRRSAYRTCPPHSEPWLSVVLPTRDKALMRFSASVAANLCGAPTTRLPRRPARAAASATHPPPPRRRIKHRASVHAQSTDAPTRAWHCRWRRSCASADAHSRAGGFAAGAALRPTPFSAARLPCGVHLFACVRAALRVTAMASQAAGSPGASFAPLGSGGGGAAPAAAARPRAAYCTLITSDSFLPGLQVLAFSLRASGSRVPLVILHTSALSDHSVAKIKGFPGCAVRAVADIPNPNEEVHVEGWVNSGYTKLHVWNLVEFERVVYLDADTLVLSNIDELFRRPAFAAAPDAFPPDKFNAGVLVLKPSRDMFEDMCAKVDALPSHDGGDTGFLNSYFPGWFESGKEHRLPFGYNALRTMHWLTYAKRPGYWESIKPLKIIHYCSNPKPWTSAAAAKRGDLEMLWWTWFLRMQMSGAY